MRRESRECGYSPGGIINILEKAKEGIHLDINTTSRLFILGCTRRFASEEN